MLNKLKKEITVLKEKQHDKELKLIYANLEKTTDRLTEELTNTKKFKINRIRYIIKACFKRSIIKILIKF